MSIRVMAVAAPELPGAVWAHECFQAKILQVFSMPADTQPFWLKMTSEHGGILTGRLQGNLAGEHFC